MKVKAMMMLKGIGWQSAWILVMELFGWRTFKNRRCLGGFAGLTGTPFASGDVNIEQGISKAGNKRVRHLMVELAWMWIRYQPQSDLALWFERRFANGGKRMRRVGIVAVARKLLIALWHFVEEGVIPTGAKLKAA
jgi:transposase